MQQGGAKTDKMSKSNANPRHSATMSIINPSKLDPGLLLKYTGREELKCTTTEGPEGFPTSILLLPTPDGQPRLTRRSRCLSSSWMGTQ